MEGFSAKQTYFKRFVDNPICEVCNQMPESTDHIIAECEFATEVSGLAKVGDSPSEWQHGSGLYNPRNCSTIPYSRQSLPNLRCPLLLAVVEA
jgi:hypothetical protein